MAYDKARTSVVLSKWTGGQLKLNRIENNKDGSSRLTVTNDPCCVPLTSHASESRTMPFVEARETTGREMGSVIS